jgi:hypothetical protein
MKNHQMWMIIVLLLLRICVSPCWGAPSEQAPSVSYCDLLSAPQNYDKRIIATEALVASSEHEVHVFDSACRSTVTDDRSASIELPNGWNSTKPGKKLSKILRHDRTAKAAFEATFYASGGPYGPEGTRFRLVMQRLISVEEIRKKETDLPSSIGKPSEKSPAH